MASIEIDLDMARRLAEIGMEQGMGPFLRFVDDLLEVSQIASEYHCMEYNCGIVIARGKCLVVITTASKNASLCALRNAVEEDMRASRHVRAISQGLRIRNEMRRESMQVATI